MNVKERFLNYVVIDSGSSETTGTHPSTEKQWIWPDCWKRN